MEISKAQRDVRTTFLGGFVGQTVSATLWLGSAAVSTWHSRKLGISLLVIGGFFIFPAVQLVLRIMKRPKGLPAGHPMNALAMQIAFTLPLSLPLVAAATMYRPAWFYPSFMIVLGAHYLPFTFLYGMQMFLALCGILVAAGLGLALYLPAPYSTGAWLTAAVLYLFAFIGWIQVKNER
ncbi:MAG TPA: hypothetical protein PLA90_18445 [Candidatus Sumerlaeota bacterium]|nr:hypothetical protein [Candidatus Sumerlaeota bacterium]